MIHNTLNNLMTWPRALSLLALALILPAGALEANSMARLQRISLSYSHDEPIKAAALSIYKRSWKDACERLGLALTAFQGYYQHGAFSKHRCLGFNPDKKDPKTHRWHLQVREKEDQVVLELSYQLAKNKEKMILGRFEFGSSSQTLLALADDMVASQIAYALLDQLPMARVISRKEWRQRQFGGVPLIKTAPVTADEDSGGFTDWMKDKPQKTKSRRRGQRRKKGSVTDPIVPYKAYFLYHLAYDEETKSWQPKLLGYAKLDKAKRAPIDPDKPATSTWKITAIRKPDNGRKAIFASNRLGRAAAGKMIARQAYMSLAQYGIKPKNSNMLADTLASGYVGIRYGFPMLKVQSIIAQSSVISAFSDFRGGPLKGFRLMYDFAPEVKQTFIEGDASFSWDRLSLGWSLNFDVGSDPAKRIDIIPRLGVASYKANLPVVNAQTGIRSFAPFVVDKALNYGIEVGAETETAWLLLRGWGAFDTAGQSENNAKVTSIRGGLDAYWDLFEISDSFDLTILTFVNGERLSMSAQADNTTPGTVATGLRFSLAFAGVGLTITW